MEHFKIYICEDITETVQESVESSIKSYSEAVKCHGAISYIPAITQKTLKTAAKQFAVEEELSTNIITRQSARCLNISARSPVLKQPG